MNKFSFTLVKRGCYLKQLNGFLAKVSLSHFSGAASRGSKKTDEETRGKMIQGTWIQLYVNLKIDKIKDITVILLVFT